MRACLGGCVILRAISTTRAGEIERGWGTLAKPSSGVTLGRARLDMMKPEKNGVSGASAGCFIKQGTERQQTLRFVSFLYVLWP